MSEQPEGPDLEAAHIAYVTEDTHVDKADAWDRNALKNAEIERLRAALTICANHADDMPRVVKTAVNALAVQEGK